MTTKEPQRTEFPPRVWIRTEPYHDDALAKGAVVSTDIANHYARRGSHWIEYVHNEEHAAAIAELERKLKVATEALEFYADRSNWEEVYYNEDDGENVAGDIQQKITMTDIEYKENPDGEILSACGGLRARKALAEIGGGE